jgi:phage shock protein E
MVTDRRARDALNYMPWRVEMKPDIALAAVLAIGLVGALNAQATISASPMPLPRPGLLGVEAGKALLDSRADIILLDVRTAEEFATGRVRGAKLLPYDEIDEASAREFIPAKDSPVIVYCRSGRRSAIAAKSLRELGYSRVYDMGGVNSWRYGLVK